MQAASYKFSATISPLRVTYWGLELTVKSCVNNVTVILISRYKIHENMKGSIREVE